MLQDVSTIATTALNRQIDTGPFGLIRRYPVAALLVLTFGLTLERMAFSLSRLAAERPLAAMRARPELIGGEGAYDTQLMQKLPGWAAKRGAEGLICAASPDGLGVALKVEDGNPRALKPALAAFLGGLGFSLDGFASPALQNSRGENVGVLEVVA